MTGSISELLARDEVTAVVVATPAVTHLELASAALESGRDVLLEKPMALTADDCRKLNEIANVTPPVGLNIFTIQGAMGKDITAEEMYVGVWPFVCCDIIVLIFLITLPDIVLWLPNLILGN